MGKVWNKLKKRWATVWLTAVLLLVAVFVTYAAYTEVSSVKRVVSTQKSPSVLFSSNSMRPSISTLRLTSSEYTLTVCNFDQDKPTMYNPSQITYTLHAEIQVNLDGVYYTMAQLSEKVTNEVYNSYVSKISNSEKYYIYKTYDDTDPNTPLAVSKQGFNSGNGYKVSFAADTLAAAKSSVDRFKIGLELVNNEGTNDIVNNIFLHVWAEPSSPSNLTTIETRLYGAAASADTSTWTGALLETNCAEVDYDFYNYVITGSGKGKIDIMWNPAEFEINPFFFIDSGNKFEKDGDNKPIIETIDENDTSHPNWKKVTISVDSTEKNRYELQLYKTDSGKSFTGENAATKYIACSFNEEN